jgi:hypothetical protein
LPYRAPPQTEERYGKFVYFVRLDDEPVYVNAESVIYVRQYRGEGGGVHSRLFFNEKDSFVVYGDPSETIAKLEGSREIPI